MDVRGGPGREHIRRGFSIHQKVVLEVDFSGTLFGYTEIDILPTSNGLRTIHLHSRQCTIHSVTVGGYQADFLHYDPVANISLPERDCHRHMELKRKLYTALQEGDEGELSIAVPKEVLPKIIGSAIQNETGRSESTPEPQSPEPSGSSTLQSGQQQTVITVKVSYSLRNPVDGFEFVLPSDSHPHRVPHAYTTPSSPDAARCWLPCIDNPWEKCTWEFEFIVPRYLEETDYLDEDELNDATPTVVACSAELVSQIAHPFRSNKTIFLFSQTVPTSPQHIAFAVGPFHIHTIPIDHISDENTVQPRMYAFYLPGHETYVTPTTATLRSAMSFYTTEFGSYPYTSYKLVFIDELPTQRFDSASLSLITVDLLHGEDTIEQSIESRHILSHALACQWVGLNIQPKTWSDLWLVNGLALYITGLFLKKLFGNNEWRFRMKKDMQRVIEWDTGSMPPICQPQKLDPPDASNLPFINLKAPLILHILDRKLGKSGTSLGLSRVLPKIFLSAISGEMQNNCLGTHAFLRMCRKVSGVDLRLFAEQWIYGSGCPAFGVQASFNRKKMAVEITMRQENPAFKYWENDEAMKLLMKPAPFFEGSMTIRIHEADGTPYEHVLDIRSPFKRYEVPFNTKYKRVRRNTKRYLARQAAAQAAAEGDAEAAEAMGMIDMAFGLDIWEKEEERENWKVADWTEEDESLMSGATYEWIRMDADFEWITNLKFEQPDFMWVSQLQRDRDVVAQLEAVHALAAQPTLIVSSTLTKTVLVGNYHCRIRCEAAAALVKCAVRRLDFLGLFHLFKLFLRYCYDPEDPNQDLFTHTYVPKPNDFSDLSEYFVRKSLVDAISQVRFENGKTPTIVRQFLTDQLRFNDNTANPYSDALYICALISAAGCANVSTAAPERGELLPSEVRTEHTDEDRLLVQQCMAEVDRYRSMDRLIPSSHNVVTIAALEFYTLLGVANLIPSQLKVFFPLTREGNYTPVRIAAFDGLFLTKWFAPPIMRYVLTVMATDPSRIIRRHVARSVGHSLALLVQMGEIKTSWKESESLLIEEDGSGPAFGKESRKTELDAMIKSLRKDREIGKNEYFREFMVPIALAHDVDQEVRWGILKMADLLLRPVDEAPPTVKIHIAPPTTTEPQPPPVKLAVKPLKPVVPKAVATPDRSPSIPLIIPPALRLPPSQADPQPRALTPKSSIGPKKSDRFAVPAVPNKVKPAQPMPLKRSTIPKGLSAGMSTHDFRACRNALKKLQSSKHAPVFLQPVDPIRDHAPNYFDIIKNPMDLSTMSARLEQGHYPNRSAFEADFHLLIENAKQYNAPGTFVYDAAVGLEAFFQKQWAVITKTLESKMNAVPKAPPKNAVTPKPASETPTRPTIKLKVGGGHSSASTPKPAPKANNVRMIRPPNEPVHVDEPPPAYVDDGSHDILQEVIAIELEKEQEKKRQHGHPEVNGKRKIKDVELDDDDDILALVSPAKKERHSPPTASTSVSQPPHPKPIPIRSKPADTATPEVSRVTSLKGKETEKQALSSPIKAKPSPHQSGAPLMERKCKDLLKLLTSLKESFLFLRPVDPVEDGCPTYLDEIKRPMDFGTMSQKLASHKYSTMEEFAEDAQLIFSNCRQFNPPNTFPVQYADAVERVFKKEWSKIMERKIPFADKRSLLSILTTLQKDPQFYVFREPVDPVALNIPMYFEIIPRKDARDLKTIRNKLENDKYDTIESFEADIALMVANAIKFNGADSVVGQMGVSLQRKFEELHHNWKTGASKKRKDNEKTTSQPTKKMRLV